MVLIAVMATLLLFGGGWVLARNSSLSSVEHVRVSGVHGAQAGAVEAALTQAARRMSTMHVDVGRLRAAVVPLRVVSDIRVKAHFPHTLQISVIEQLPVAALVTVGGQTAVAGNGVVLGPGLLSSGLPVVHGATLPASGRIGEAKVRAELAVLGAVPGPLASHVLRAFIGQQGVTVLMRNGLRIYFGDASRAHAKWVSAARVLADPSSAGAWYVDVRLPERPAAGIAGLTSSSTAQVGASDPSAAAIAASLAGAVAGAGEGASGGLPPVDANVTQGASQATGTSGATTGSPTNSTSGATTGSTTSSPSGATANPTTGATGNPTSGATTSPTMRSTNTTGAVNGGAVTGTSTSAGTTGAGATGGASSPSGGTVPPAPGG